MMNRLFRKIVSAVSAATLAVPGLAAMSASAEVEPNPVISRNVPAYSGYNPATAPSANDDFYYTSWFGMAPDYLAYDLSGVPDEQKKQVIAVWYNTSSYDSLGSYVSKNMQPTDYTIEINKAPGGTYPEDGWEVVETVENNRLSSRQHVLSMEGYNWIRMNLLKADGETGKQASINFDIHNVSNGISDSWLFLGDSITAGGMVNAWGTSFATFVSRLDPKYFPVQENGGIGGITSRDGKENIDRWLSTYPGKYVSIAYGTNDAWGNQIGADNYYANTKYMIDAVLALGKTPVLPKIPYATEPGVNTYLPEYNAKIDLLWEEYGDKLVKGPDFEAYFKENPEGLSSDGVHPSSEGYEEMRRIWAETMYANVYSAGSTEEEYDYGDANLDHNVDMSDVVLLMQALSNKDKYGVGGSDQSALTEKGLKYADCYDPGSGLSVKDPLAIQKMLLELIASLPETP